MSEKMVFSVRVNRSMSGLDDYYINGRKVDRMAYVREFRKLLLEDARDASVTIQVGKLQIVESQETGQQAEERPGQSYPPRLARVPSALRADVSRLVPHNPLPLDEVVRRANALRGGPARFDEEEEDGEA